MVEEGSVVQGVVQGGVVEGAGAVPEGTVIATQPGALASEEPYSGPRNGLLSTDEISGEYSGCSLLGCGTTTVVPHGPDLIELWHEWCLWCPCGLDLLVLGPLASRLFGIPKAFGPYMAGEVRRRMPGTNDFALEVHESMWDGCCPDNMYPMAFTASGAVSGSLLSLQKRPNSERAFQKVATLDIAGGWVSGCCCWLPMCSCDRYSAVDEDRYTGGAPRGVTGDQVWDSDDGVWRDRQRCLDQTYCCAGGVPYCHIVGESERIYVDGHATNGFRSDTNIVSFFRADARYGSVRATCAVKC